MRKLLPIIFLFVPFALSPSALAEGAPTAAAWQVDLEVEPERLALSLPLVAQACSELQTLREGTTYAVKICDDGRPGRASSFVVEVERAHKEKGTVRFRVATRLPPGKKTVLGQLDAGFRVSATLNPQGG